jgi:hypothetical protein
MGCVRIYNNSSQTSCVNTSACLVRSAKVILLGVSNLHPVNKCHSFLGSFPLFPFDPSLEAIQLKNCVTSLNSQRKKTFQTLKHTHPFQNVTSLHLDGVPYQDKMLSAQKYGHKNKIYDGAYLSVFIWFYFIPFLFPLHTSSQTPHISESYTAT